MGGARQDHVTLYDEIIVLLLFQIRKENEWCEEK